MSRGKGKLVWNLDLNPSACNSTMDANNCTAHALSAALGCPFNQAQTITFAAGRLERKGMFDTDLVKWCNNLVPDLFIREDT